MHLNIWHRGFWKLLYLLIIINFILLVLVNCTTKGINKSKFLSKGNHGLQKICLNVERTLKAQHKSCFLRPDTGPCRADIIQWYYDVKQGKCFRFYWGGCQGNGNRFETEEQCSKYCVMKAKDIPKKIPFFCSLGFDYGRCFGHFYRFAWDTYSKSCIRRLYSGCGGNQNNFQTRIECYNTCLYPPNNTLDTIHSFTTCIPVVVPEIQ